MTANVNIDVFLQALGGKYLGPNAYQTSGIRIDLHYSGGHPPIPYNHKSQDDGQVNAIFSDGSSSPFPILKQQSGAGPEVYYLTPGSDPIKGSATVPLSKEYEVASLTVEVPTPNGTGLFINSFLVLTPAQAYYRITIPVRGLLLEPVFVPEGTANLGLYVKMMCGCPITNDGTKFWPAIDFEVCAEVHYQNGTTEKLLMNFPGKVESFYTVSTSSGRGGVKQVYFSAFQRSTANYGYAQLFK